jgi:hypothetical protein
MNATFRDELSSALTAHAVEHDVPARYGTLERQVREGGGRPTGTRVRQRKVDALADV